MCRRSSVDKWRTAVGVHLFRCGDQSFGGVHHVRSDWIKRQGLPIRFFLTGGLAADITQAIPLLAGIKMCVVLADKGYDADDLLAWLKERAITAVNRPDPTGKRPGHATSGSTKSVMWSSACSGSSSITAGCFAVMRKSCVISWAWLPSLPSCYGFDSRRQNVNRA